MIIDQCLFGYDDGHRLLISSLRIPSDVALELTPLSDLSPGAWFGSKPGYWTGVPVPKLGRYALMYTWPANEMPRPGCVWTHALLLDLPVLEAAANLGFLRKLVRRPFGLDDRSSYARVLEIDPVTTSLMSESVDYEFSHVAAQSVLRALYEFDASSGETAAGTPDDTLVFAVWSQQWPKLRRNFRFQTAEIRGGSGSGTRFDLQFRAGLDEAALSALPRNDAWLRAAIEDLSPSDDHLLREFLWRYGGDVVRQRGSFKPLCEVFLAGSFGRSSVMLSRIARSFPHPEDALLLKRELLEGATFPNLQLDILEFVSQPEAGSAFPEPPLVAWEQAAAHWPAQAGRLLQIAEGQLRAGTERGLLDAIGRYISNEDFFTTTAGFPTLRAAWIARHPDILSSPAVAALNSQELSALLDAIEGEERFVIILLRYLSSTASPEAAGLLADHFPDAVFSMVLSTIEEEGAALSPWWFVEITTRAGQLLAGRHLASASKWSSIYRLADVIGWVTLETTRAGYRPWWTGLANATNDLPKDKEAELSAFVLSLALRSKETSIQSVFERLFDVVHSSIVSMHLSWRGQEFLFPVLPDVGWRRGWDTGLRLRVAVAQAYVSLALPPGSFGSLSSDSYTQALLGDAADELEGGRRYSKAARKT